MRNGRISPVFFVLQPADLRITVIKCLSIFTLAVTIKYLELKKDDGMFKKMRAGELSLSVTLWKFGVLYGALLTFAVKIFERLLVRQTKTTDLLAYYTKNFSLLTPDTMAILWTLCYITIILVWIFYLLNVIVGIWRAAAAYERSLWLSGIARLLTIVLAVYAVVIVF